MKKNLKQNLLSNIKNILNQDNCPASFIANLEENINNPESKYADKVGLFKEITLLETKKDNLDATMSKLEEEKTELSNYIGTLDNEIVNLEVKKEGLEKATSDLEKAESALQENQNESKKALSEELSKERLRIVGEKKEMEENYKSQESVYQEKLKNLINKFRISENLAGIKSEAREQKIFYYIVMVILSLVLVISTNSAIKAGKDIITKYINNPESINYWGLFLLKIPYSLIVLGFISGSVILLSKLLSLVEKINNQLRNISQILAIAKTFEDKALNPFFTGNKIIVEEAQKEDLKYRLISDYLDRLGKRELEEKTEDKYDRAFKVLKKLHKIMPEFTIKKIGLKE